MIITTVLHPYSVLLGRGTGPNEHYGNRYFRDLCAKYESAWYHNNENNNDSSTQAPPDKEDGGGTPTTTIATITNNNAAMVGNRIMDRDTIMSSIINHIHSKGGQFVRKLSKSEVRNVMNEMNMMNMSSQVLVFPQQAQQQGQGQRPGSQEPQERQERGSEEQTKVSSSTGNTTHDSVIDNAGGNGSGKDSAGTPTEPTPTTAHYYIQVTNRVKIENKIKQALRYVHDPERSRLAAATAAAPGPGPASSSSSITVTSGTTHEKMTTTSQYLKRSQEAVYDTNQDYTQSSRSGKQLYNNSKKKQKMIASKTSTTMTTSTTIPTTRRLVRGSAFDSTGVAVPQPKRQLLLTSTIPSSSFFTTARRGGGGGSRFQDYEPMSSGLLNIHDTTVGGASPGSTSSRTTAAVLPTRPGIEVTVPTRDYTYLHQLQDHQLRQVIATEMIAIESERQDCLRRLEMISALTHKGKESSSLSPSLSHLRQRQLQQQED